MENKLFSQYFVRYFVRLRGFSCCLQDEPRWAEGSIYPRPVLSSAGHQLVSGSPVAPCIGPTRRPPAPGP